jgi:hypothetical protein
LAQQAKGSANAWHLAQDSNSGHTLVAERGGGRRQRKHAGRRECRGMQRGLSLFGNFRIWHTTEEPSPSFQKELHRIVCRSPRASPKIPKNRVLKLMFGPSYKLLGRKKKNFSPNNSL